MTRAATNGLLKPDDVDGHNSKHPQPVLTNYLNSAAQSESPPSPERSRRPRSATQHSNGNHDADSESDEDGGLHMSSANGTRRKGNDGQAKNGPEHPQHQSRDTSGEQSEDGEDKARARMRHGWDSQLESQEQATLLSQTFFMYYEDKRHETAGNPPPEYDAKTMVSEWRMKDRLKTVSAVLAVCLNVGVDPPDVIKTNPCARLECWVDPIPPESASQSSTNNSNAQIGKNLQSQYENLSLRTRYKVILDPTIEELRRYTTQLRRTAHQERILFHYNGHGVPKPTQSGEVWCFNRSYTQYIPISLYDIQDWVGAPGLWVWDCSAAGGIINGFLDAVQKHNHTQQDALNRDPNRAQQQPLIRWDDCIHLAACRDNEVLPTNPDLPADIFTSCLTTPIAMAVRFFILQNPLPPMEGLTPDQARNIPGKVSERRTPLGELNWIFTAITDTIAWNLLPPPLFKKLFRQDLMVAALFRNFLLAQRVMRMYHCHPRSWPEVPDTHSHPLWRSWDLAVEMILSQLPKLNEQQKAHEASLEVAALPNGTQATQPTAPSAPQPSLELEYQHSDFFADQLSAFEVYLSSAPSYTVTSHGKRPEPPEQLPIVLQVLLSQVHRLRALILLSKFLDLGPWAVNLALSIGIFPYVLKLLQSQALELKPPMVFIWARILAVDQSCQGDLLKDNGFTYFTTILTSSNGNASSGIPLGNVAEHRAMCAFVVAMFCKDFRHGQQAVLESNPEIIENCLQHLLDMENPLLRQFSLLCLGNLWKNFPAAKAVALSAQAHARVRDRSHDPVPEVRAACLDSLTTFIGTGEVKDAAVILEEETLASVIIAMGMDGSIMVRKELTVFYSGFIKKYEPRMIVACWEQLIEERDKRTGRLEEADLSPRYNGAPEQNGYDGSNYTNGINGGLPNHSRSASYTTSHGTASTSVENGSTLRASRTLSKKTIYRAMWRQILSMSADPHPEVARNAGIVVDYVLNAMLESPLGEYANQLIDELEGRKQVRAAHMAMDGLARQRSRDPRPSTPPSPSASTASRPDSYFSNMSRTASVGAALKNMIGWGPRSNFDTPPSPTSGGHRNSIQGGVMPYRSIPLRPEDAAKIDAALMPPDALDNVMGPPHQPKARVPPSPHFVERDLSKLPELPLKSNFFTWSSSYFREPQMRPSETDEPGSLDYNERLWRRNRNDKIIASTQPLKDAAGSQPWSSPFKAFGIGAAPHKMVFHQFENHIVTSDDRDSIAVWDWEKAQQICRFSNNNPPGSKVTELRFINEDDQAMLMTGSSDGVIKIFKNYDDSKTVELASSFRALSDLVVSDQQNAGLVFDWQQGQGRVLVAGDDRTIRVWQAGHELCISDINARSGSPVTSLTSDQVEGHVFVAGFGNGSIRAYDQRLAPREAMVMDWVDKKTDHTSWIVGVHLQRGGMRELISGESSGGVRLWDLRMRKAVSSIEGRRKFMSLRTLAVHEHAPVFATGNANHMVKVYNTQLKELSEFEPHVSFLQRIDPGMSRSNVPITATAFHPHRMMLACGALRDGFVNLYKCDATEEKPSPVVDEWSGFRT